MSWLNWSLKFHFRLRTISFLISTTYVYIQWMPYSFVWLYLIKCVFTCSIFVKSNTKRFLSVLGVFGKYFVWKIWKFQKSCFALFWRLSRVFAGIFWRLVREWKVQSRGLLRDFRGSVRDFLAGRPSSREKHLENFSNFCPWVFWRLDLATRFSRENRVFWIYRGSF